MTLGEPAGGRDQADETAELEAVNAELYAAFEVADIDRMGALWDDADDIVCVHPGWPMLRGRGSVLRSWSLIMANTPYIQFFLTDVLVTVQADTAVVSCTESMLTGVEPDGSADGRAVATNVFRRRDGRWRLWVHHASPVLSATPDDEAEPEEEP